MINLIKAVTIGNLHKLQKRQRDPGASCNILPIAKFQYNRWALLKDVCVSKSHWRYIAIRVQSQLSESNSVSPFHCPTIFSSQRGSCSDYRWEAWAAHTRCIYIYTRRTQDLEKHDGKIFSKKPKINSNANNHHEIKLSSTVRCLSIGGFVRVQCPLWYS